jgi:hypothetical protein
MSVFENESEQLLIAKSCAHFFNHRSAFPVETVNNTQKPLLLAIATIASQTNPKFKDVVIHMDEVSASSLSLFDTEEAKEFRKHAESPPDIDDIQEDTSSSPTVLDTFAGTGTFAVAGVLCGCNVISIESDPKQYAAFIQRLHYLQVSLLEVQGLANRIDIYTQCVSPDKFNKSRKQMWNLIGRKEDEEDDEPLTTLTDERGQKVEDDRVQEGDAEAEGGNSEVVEANDEAQASLFDNIQTPPPRSNSASAVENGDVNMSMSGGSE